jgi:hypothetical protein
MPSCPFVPYLLVTPSALRRRRGAAERNNTSLLGRYPRSHPHLEWLRSPPSPLPPTLLICQGSAAVSLPCASSSASRWGIVFIISTQPRLHALRSSSPYSSTAPARFLYHPRLPRAWCSSPLARALQPLPPPAHNPRLPSRIGHLLHIHLRLQGGAAPRVAHRCRGRSGPERPRRLGILRACAFPRDGGRR